MRALCGVHSTRVPAKQAQRLQTGLRPCDRHATKISRKWKSSYDSRCNYRSSDEFSS